MLVFLPNLQMGGTGTSDAPPPSVSPRAAFLAQSYFTVAVDHPNEIEHRRELAVGVDLALDGKVRSVGSLTLAASTDITIVQDRRVGPKSIILLMPTTANAGGEMGWWFSEIGELSSGIPSFKINHAIDSRTDRTFSYVVLG